VEVKNADLDFINNDNLGDSFVAIRGEADDVNGAFRTRSANTCKLTNSAPIEAVCARRPTFIRSTPPGTTFADIAFEKSNNENEFSYER